MRTRVKNVQSFQILTEDTDEKVAPKSNGPRQWSAINTSRRLSPDDPHLFSLLLSPLLRFRAETSGSDIGLFSTAVRTCKPRLRSQRSQNGSHSFGDIYVPIRWAIPNVVKRTETFSLQ